MTVRTAISTALRDRVIACSSNWGRFVLAVALCVISAWTINTRTVKPPVPDNYEMYAYALAEWGTFGLPKDSQTQPQPGIGRAPLYPLFLAAIMRVDARDKSRGACYVDQGHACSLRGGLTPLVQVAIAAVSIFFIYEIALLFGALPFSALVLSLWAGVSIVRLAYEYQLSEVLGLPLFGLASLAMARWYSGHSGLQTTALAGVSIGLLSLTRVAYDYALPIVVLTVLVIAPAARAGVAASWRRRALAAALLVAGYTAAVAPWHMRNYSQFGTLSASSAGVNGVLAMRASYNRMSLEEGVVAVVHFLPDFGDKLAKALFPERLTSKFDFDNPDGFRQQGWRMLAEANRLSGEPADAKRTLLSQMFDEPFRHALVSIPLTIDGLRYVFWMLPLAIYAMVGLVRRRQWWICASLVMTAFTLAFHAATTHFRSRYGMPMLYGFAPLAALGLSQLMGLRQAGFDVPQSSKTVPS